MWLEGCRVWRDDDDDDDDEDDASYSRSNYSSNSRKNEATGK